MKRCCSWAIRKAVRGPERRGTQRTVKAAALNRLRISRSITDKIVKRLICKHNSVMHSPRNCTWQFDIMAGILHTDRPFKLQGSAKGTLTKFRPGRTLIHVLSSQTVSDSFDYLKRYPVQVVSTSCSSLIGTVAQILSTNAAGVLDVARGHWDVYTSWKSQRSSSRHGSI